jgi:hypothetical protein
VAVNALYVSSCPPEEGKVKKKLLFPARQFVVTLGYQTSEGARSVEPVFHGKTRTVAWANKPVFCKDGNHE